MSTISTTSTALRRRHPINRYTRDLSTVMNRAGRLWRWGKAAAILKRATACWCITFLAVVFARTAVAVFLFLVLAKEKRLTAGSVTAFHAEYLLAEEKDLILLPDALSYEDGAFISCGVGTAYEGILRGEVSGSDNVLVVGLGRSA